MAQACKARELRILTPKLVFLPPHPQLGTNPQLRNRKGRLSTTGLLLVPLRTPQHTGHIALYSLTIAEEVLLHSTPQPLGLLQAVHAPEAILHSNLGTQAQAHHVSPGTGLGWRRDSPVTPPSRAAGASPDQLLLCPRP